MIQNYINILHKLLTNDNIDNDDIKKNLYMLGIFCEDRNKCIVYLNNNKLLKLIEKRRLLIPIPLIIARLSAIIFQLFPKPLLTTDQLTLLKYDNVASGKYKTNFDIGFPSIHKFDLEVKKYAFMWKESGQFSKKKNNT